MSRSLTQIDSRNRNAFTLIELLVVVSIIALLVAILLPSLSKARDQARQVVCLANFRTVGIGIHFYLDDFDNHLPIWGRTDHRTYKWDYHMSEYVGGQHYEDGMLIFHCPGDPRESPWLSVPELATMAMNAYMNKDWGYVDFEDTKTPEKKILISEAISDPTLATRIINPSTDSYYSSHKLANLHGNTGYSSTAADYFGNCDSNNVLFADMHLELKHIDDMPDMTIAPEIWWPSVE